MVGKVLTTTRPAALLAFRAARLRLLFCEPFLPASEARSEFAGTAAFLLPFFFPYYFRMLS